MTAFDAQAGHGQQYVAFGNRASGGVDDADLGFGCAQLLKSLPHRFHASVDVGLDDEGKFFRLTGSDS